ncbi:hypothetical protein HYW35_03540 [Candidatus Saccharibacteria bacterium]|nr:hypothetical protein [Candidatus Saccharibacteria bacterium]
MLKTIERSGVLSVQSPPLEFHAGFPVIHIAEAERALFERFQAVGHLASVANFMAQYDGSREYPKLGVLNTDFSVGRHRVDLTPMGANKDVLLGYFNLAELHYQPERPVGEAIRDLFGLSDLGERGLGETGYAVLERRSHRASGFGVSRYLGKVAAFRYTPEDSDLMEFADAVVSGTPEFPIARFDRSHSPGHSKRVILKP